MDDYNDKGYVIRCADKIDGTILYRGSKSTYSRKKDALMPQDTYTISGAKRAKANLERMYPDGAFYSIERLSSYYLSIGDDTNKTDNSINRQRICKDIEHAMKRLDELWEGNDFNRGDKMRINEVRAVLRGIKAEIITEEDGE